MKFTKGVKIIISTLLAWQSCLAKEIKTYQADICVYGGTASGVMAALAAEKEGAKVILIEPTRNLGGMTCLLYTSPSPRDQRGARMPSSA